MEDLKRILVGLLHAPGMTWTQIARIMRFHFSLASTESPPFLNSLPRGKVTPEDLAIYNSLSEDSISKLILHYSNGPISLITIFDDSYPEILKQIYQPPWALFAIGDLEILAKEPKLAVVGARQATQYGKNAIRLLFPSLIKSGLVIVSGLAKGIDAHAHECAIRNQGKTIAVIAGGFYHIYPEENRKLANEMMKSQLVLSEYPPDTKPARWHFPMRNRIISGISRGTLVIEAKNKSGSLITANYAVNEGREVFSLPGSIFNPLSGGTNELIQQGAKLVMNPSDILEEFYF